MAEVTLAQILKAREDRVLLQQNLLKAYGCALISFTMNIAGPVKRSPLIERAFRTGLDSLDRQLPSALALERRIDISDTGCQAIYCVKKAASELKQLCMSIEDSSPLGRLFDLDVIDPDGVTLKRTSLRGCIVCGAPGRGCAAGRLHSVSELQSATNRIITEHFARADRERIAVLAVQSLIDEVNTTPKPGLVDRRNNGSHRDMDISTFMKSAETLESYFQNCVNIGQLTASQTPEETFALLRTAGLSAEKEMYAATGGINTHKGIIYTLGILCGALGRLWTPETPIAPIPRLFDECAQMVKRSVASDIAAFDGSTAGQRLYLNHGIPGIRGEVAAGLPSVQKISLPAYQNGLRAGLNANDAGVTALLHLIAEVKDTNLYRRGGVEGAEFASNAARALLSESDFPTTEQVEALDDVFIAKNLSPGGCADLLAVTYFVSTLIPYRTFFPLSITDPFHKLQSASVPGTVTRRLP